MRMPAAATCCKGSACSDVGPMVATILVSCGLLLLCRPWLLGSGKTNEVEVMLRLHNHSGLLVEGAVVDDRQRQAKVREAPTAARRIMMMIRVFLYVLSSRPKEVSTLTKVDEDEFVDRAKK